MLVIFLYFINFCASKSWLSFWTFYVKIVSSIHHQTGHYSDIITEYQTPK